MWLLSRSAIEMEGAVKDGCKGASPQEIGEASPTHAPNSEIG